MLIIMYDATKTLHEPHVKIYLSTILNEMFLPPLKYFATTVRACSRYADDASPFYQDAP